MKSHWRLVCHLTLALIAAVSLYAAFALRFDFVIPQREMRSLWIGVCAVVLVKPIIFCDMGRSFNIWWHYAGIADVPSLIRTNLLASTGFTLIMLLVIGPEFPRSVYLLDLLISFLMTSGLIFAGRLREVMPAARFRGDTRGLVIYGAGVAGITLAREVRANPSLGYTVLGFIDDDMHKQGSTLMALPVLGSGDDVARIAKTLQGRQPGLSEIVVTMPSATRRQIRSALQKCAAAGVTARVVPDLGELISGKLGLARARELSVNDLLRREPVSLELHEVRRQLAGRSVLVTGAAGSIGSELCRQLATFAPGVLVALDQAESDLFRLEWELREKEPALKLAPEVGDIRDFDRMDEVIRRYSIDAVFHAAAYKHVPMMEANVLEAVKNNVLGTSNVAQASYRHRVSTFLMISSDKAVNPTSIMGLTKRAAELITAAMPNGERTTRFMSVRFGNVLVSNGSVVPTFQRQISAGGPVTVTHPNVKRYFMTVQEAVQLVLHASTLGKGSDIFVLDMGEPVQIMDLAADMIRQSGFVPNQDIEIRIVGLRPGEKLFEELSLEGENILPTSHPKIKRFKGAEVDMHTIEAFISQLQHEMTRRDERAVLTLLRETIPEYQPTHDTEAAVTAAAGGDAFRQAMETMPGIIQGSNGLRPA